MTNVSEYTEIVRRHHVVAPIEHGVLSDLEMLAHMARQGTGSTYDDAARLVPDDENVHVVWEEVVDKNAKDELIEFYRWVSVGNDTELASRLGSLIKQYREDMA